MNDFTGYMQCDPYFRNHHYGELTFSMLYAYSENFVLVFSHDEVVHGKASMLCKMPGDDYEAKSDNLRAAYGFMYGHPGKKLLFMGQEFAQISEWNENEELPWDILNYPVHKNMQDYVKALNNLYKSHPAMYQEDFNPEGFEWINCISGKDNMVSFLRKTDKKEETLLFVCNFAPVEHEQFQIGVPFAGKYKEIFNSDDKAFGGSGKGNPRVKTSKAAEYDGRENSMIIDVPPMSVIVFSCTPAPAKKTGGAGKKAAAEKKAEPEKKAAAEKKAEPEKKAVAEKKAELEKKAETKAPVTKKTTAGRKRTSKRSK